MKGQARRMCRRSIVKIRRRCSGCPLLAPGSQNQGSSLKTGPRYAFIPVHVANDGIPAARSTLLSTGHFYKMLLSFFRAQLLLDSSEYLALPYSWDSIDYLKLKLSIYISVYPTLPNSTLPVALALALTIALCSRCQSRIQLKTSSSGPVKEALRITQRSSTTRKSKRTSAGNEE